MPYFLGSSVSSCLGSSVDSCVTALREPPQNSDVIECNVFDSVESIPYKLLKEPLENKSQRLYQVLDTVIQQAIDDAKLNSEQIQNMALFVGSSSFDISVSEHCYQQEIKECKSPLPLRLSSFGNVASYIRRRFLLMGADYSFNTACTASANALLSAGGLIKNGVIEHALIVGVELYNDITALGFHGLDLLTNSVMKPFDSDRDGLVLGEACSALVIGCSPIDSYNRNQFYLKGGSNCCDTYGISSANPDGSMIANVIDKALMNAETDVGDIVAIKAHGTASLSNDEAEAAGMLSVFDDMPVVVALKPYVGHTLGACGLTELILFYRAIEKGFLPATPGIGNDGDGLNIELNQHCCQPDSGNFLLNYFGFGGNNSSIVIANV